MNYPQNFLYALKEVLGIEAGYVNDKLDSGGATNFGITEATAREAGYTGDMKDLTKEEAIDIYYRLFWKRYHLDLIENPEIAKEVFEFGVNAGMRLAIKNLQRAFNILNEDIIKEDGVLGRITAGKVNSYKDPETFLKIQNILQGMFYIGLAEADESIVENIRNHKERQGSHKYKHFIRGWIRKRVNL